MSFIKKGRDVYFITKKVERIAAAIHLLTARIQDDPMSKKIREASASCLHITMQDPFQGAVINKTLEWQKSFLTVLHNSEYISPMNYEIVCEEIDNVRIVVSEVERENQKTGPIFTREYFKVPFRDRFETPPKNQAVSSFQDKGQFREEREVSKGHFITSKGQKTPTSILKDSNVTYNNGRDERIKSILSIVDSIGSVTIKDISRTIKDLSEKTIQRELLALVGKGILQKNGERRWSTYSMAERKEI